MEFSSAAVEEPLLQNLPPYNNKVYPVGLLLVTIGLETAGTLMLKYSLVDNRVYVVAFVCYFLSLGMFSYVLKYIPLSIAYTTWCTLGTVLVCVLSNVLYGEVMNAWKWGCVVLTIPCVAGLYVL